MLSEFGREAAGESFRQSFAGRMGHVIEPVIAPLGFDWKIGIGIIASFAAREVFVSTMSTVYNVGEYDRSKRRQPTSPRFYADRSIPMDRRFTLRWSRLA